MGMDKYTMDPAKDPLFRGEFPVVLALMGKLKGAKEAKNELDMGVDKNGTPKTGGNGIKQLRENIAESKLSYEIMDDAAQAFLKVKIMDNIHKYYYLIVFTTYMREMAEVARTTMTDEQKAALTLPGGKTAIPGNQLKLPRTFAAFMEEHSELRGLLTLARETCSGSVTFLPLLWPTLRNLLLVTSRRTLERSSMTSTRPHISCPQTCPRVTTRSAPSTGCLQDPDEDPPCPREGRGGRFHREEDHQP